MSNNILTVTLLRMTSVFEKCRADRPEIRVPGSGFGVPGCGFRVRDALELRRIEVDPHRRSRRSQLGTAAITDDQEETTNEHE